MFTVEGVPFPEPTPFAYARIDLYPPALTAFASITAPSSVLKAVPFLETMLMSFLKVMCEP